MSNNFLELDYDAIIIGAGPGGSALSSLLSKAGKKVIVIEKTIFPRFHVGESLLPASTSMLRELGMEKYLEKNAVHKPGGVWIYGNSKSGKERKTGGWFSSCTKKASFVEKPYAYMVKRAEFDHELAKKSEENGTKILYNHIAEELLYEEDKVVGLKIKNKGNDESIVLIGKMVYDCSGLNSFIGKKLKLRYSNDLKRMAVFGHFKTKAVHPNLQEGCFLGHVISNGWTWYIPLGNEETSIGVVAPLEEIRSAKKSPEDFLLKKLKEIKHFDQVMALDFKLVGEVKMLSNYGANSTSIFGKGWATIGDAAFFVDPCFSSGVHFSLLHAKKMAEVHLKYIADEELCYQKLEELSGEMAIYVRNVKTAVDTFYMTSQSKWARWISPLIFFGPVKKMWLTSLGGDFEKYRWFMVVGYWFIKSIHFIEKLFTFKKIKKIIPESQVSLNIVED